MKIALTDAAVQRLKVPAAGQLDITDKGYPGLVFRLSLGGRRTWCLFCRHGGKLRRITLGTYPIMGLKEAREAWRQAREDLQAGRDPRARAPRASSRDTFAAVAEQWLKIDQAGKRTVGEAERIIRRYCVPLHGVPVGTITRRDLRDLIRTVAADGEKVTMARRVHGRLQRLFTWAVSEDLIEASPMMGLHKPGIEVKRDRILTDVELATVWLGCEDLGWPFAPIIRLLILTGARRSEIGELKWREIDGDLLRLPGVRTKQALPHIIPLSAPARAIVASLPRIADSQFVFTTNGRNPVSGWSNAKRQLASFEEPWVLHDLRRTVATGLQRLNVNLQVIEAVLGHVSGSRSGIVGVYQHHSFDQEKRAALDVWGAHVMALIERGRIRQGSADNEGAQ